MERIGDWIRNLRLELEQALSDSGPLPSGVRLEPDRVTLTVPLDQFAVASAAMGQSAGEAGSGNQLTIEFKVCQPPNQSGPELIQGEPAPCHQSPDELQTLILESATAAFGARGFDNSARAEVFC